MVITSTRRRASVLRAAALAVLTLPLSLQAQDPQAGKTDYAIRHWKDPVEQPSLAPDLKPADRPLFMRAVAEVMQRLAALPAFRSPAPEKCHGLSAMFPPVQYPAPAPPRAEVAIKQYSWARVGCLVSDRFVDDGLTVLLNDPQAALGVSRSDAHGTFHLFRGELPGPGITQYEDRTIITRGPAPLLLPVTKERYLGYLIAQAEARVRDADSGLVRGQRVVAQAAAAPTMAQLYEQWLREGKPQTLATIARSVQTMRDMGRPEKEITATRAQMEASVVAMEKTWSDNVARERAGPPRLTALPPALVELNARLRQDAVAELESLRSQLARLDAGGRRAPACADPKVVSVYDECPADVNLVVPNPSYFDPGLRGAVQLIVIRGGPPAVWQAVRGGAGLETLLR